MHHDGLLSTAVLCCVAVAAAAQPAGWSRHAQAGLGFAIGVPPGFVVQAMPVVTTWAPVPRAVLAVAAQGQAEAVRAGADLPALQLRVFDADRPLADWLQAQPALADARRRQLPDGAVELCPATPLGPGCSVWRARGRRVVQLLPQGDEGSAIAASFEWTIPP